LPAIAASLADGVAPATERLLRLGPVSRFDRWVDHAVDSRARGNPAVDRVFYAASALGDHGIIWLILAVLRGLRSHDSARATLRTAAAIGLESMLVNGPVKWVFRRKRPAPRPVSPHPLRTPRTSSFPSGHATSAFCAAALLSDTDPAMRPVYYGLATIVAWSRVHVGVHHASDVIGGVAIGVVLGKVFKRLVPLPHPDPRPGPGPSAPPRRESAPATAG
jgi:undecaprenyl-diphosphatase